MGALFSKSQFHGNIKWVPERLATQALIWSWQDTKKFTDAFEKTQEICKRLELTEIAKTYTAFMNALDRFRETIHDGLREGDHDDVVMHGLTLLLHRQSMQQKMKRLGIRNTKE